MTPCERCGQMVVRAKEYKSGRVLLVQEVDPAYRDLSDVEGDAMIEEITEETVYVNHSLLCRVEAITPLP